MMMLKNVSSGILLKIENIKVKQALNKEHQQ